MTSSRSVLALVVVFMLAVIPAYAQTGDRTEPVPVLRTAEEAWRLDAAEYVKAYGGTIDEAVRRLKLQNHIAELEETLQAREHATFGGLWIEHTPRYRVVVQFTRGGQETIRPYIQNGPLADVVEVQPAPVSRVQLKAIHAELIQTMEAIGIRAESGTSQQKSRLELFVTDRAQLEAALAKVDKRLPERVEVVTVPTLSTPQRDWYGGIGIGSNSCTTGLSVKGSNGTKYSSSAGHCNNANVVPLSPILTSVGGAYDLRILSVPAGDTVKNWVGDNTFDSTPYYREINTYTPRGSVGTIVCKTGITTGYTCGTIEMNDYNYQGSATWMLAKATNANDKISCGGDSGAAWFSGNTAHGIHTAGWCSLDPNLNKAVFMPVKGLLDYNYAPMTIP